MPKLDRYQIFAMNYNHIPEEKSSPAPKATENIWLMVSGPTTPHYGYLEKGKRDILYITELL